MATYRLCEFYNKVSIADTGKTPLFTVHKLSLFSCLPVYPSIGVSLSLTVSVFVFTLSLFVSVDVLQYC